ncbi:MAG: hypothetical protein ACK2UH_05490 [Candidatus Promineifilaceae bacterium]
MTDVTIVNVGYRSTNYWVVSAGRSRLLVDLGWPGSMGRMIVCRYCLTTVRPSPAI